MYRNKFTWQYLFPVLFALLFSCANQSSSPGKIVEEIIKADNAGDIDKILALYSKDAILMPAGKPDITGQAAIRENYRNIFSSSKLELSAHIDEIAESGNLALIRGTISGSVIRLSDNISTNVNDKFLMSLKKNGAEWKISRLMWSKN